MMMMVLVSKQHEVTTKYKMQAKSAFFPYLSVGENTLSYKNAGQVDFQVTCPAGRVAVETIF